MQARNSHLQEASANTHTLRKAEDGFGRLQLSFWS
jgi:hypothetical protein